MDDFSTGSFPNFDAAKAALGEEISVDDFWSHLPEGKYIFTPLNTLWTAKSVNARLPRVPITVINDDGEPEERKIPPSIWLNQHRRVEQWTWMPGESQIIEGRLLRDSGWIERPGVHVFNLYQPPLALPGNAAEAGEWLRHVHRVYPDDAEHLLDWFAHRAQFPAVKINHAVVLIGEPGVGKDTLLAPVRMAIGTWNFGDVSPKQAMGRFNAHLRNVILRINEARDLGESNRFAFYETCKIYLAAPPEVLRIDEKNLREYSIPNLVGVIITSNHLTTGIYLPPEDRRHYVAHSHLTQKDFPDGYWKNLWHWYREEGGFSHAAAWLRERDLSRFDPQAPPRKTDAFWAIADANAAPELPELADRIDELRDAEGVPPAAITLETLRKADGSSLYYWLTDPKNHRVIPLHLEQCGYVPVRDPAATDGLWKVAGKRQAIYARRALTAAQRLLAARRLKETADKAKTEAEANERASSSP